MWQRPLRTKLREREEQIVRACEAANQSADILAIEAAMDTLADDADRVQEPW